jgi:hypothetical protein
VTYGGDSGNRIFVLYWRCSLIRVSIIRGSTVLSFYPIICCTGLYSSMPQEAIHNCLMTCSSTRLKRSGASPSPCFKLCLTSKSSSVCILRQEIVFCIVNSTSLTRFHGILNSLILWPVTALLIESWAW